MPSLEFNLKFVNINKALFCDKNQKCCQGRVLEDSLFIHQLPITKKQILAATWSAVKKEPLTQDLMGENEQQLDPRLIVGQCALGNILAKKNQDYPLIFETLNYPETIQCLFPYATSLITEGRWDQAISIYKLILTQRPDHIQARTNLAEYLYSTGDKPEAAKHYKILIEQNPTAFSYYRLLQAYRISGQTDESIETVLQATALFPDDPWLKYEMAEVYLNEGKSEEAIGYLKDQLNLDPENPRLWYVLCRVYSEIDEIDDSADACRQAIVVDADYLDPYLWISKMLLKQNQFQEALDYAIKFLDRTIDSGTRLEFIAYMNLGDVYFKQGNRSQAMNAYCQSVKLNRWPDFREYLLYQIEILDGECIMEPE